MPDAQNQWSNADPLAETQQAGRDKRGTCPSQLSWENSLYQNHPVFQGGFERHLYCRSDAGQGPSSPPSPLAEPFPKNTRRRLFLHEP